MKCCLDREHRAAYVIGEILELDHREAASALGISAATFRKRLSRARARVLEFTRRSCGLVNPKANCRCARRLAPAIALQRVDPQAPAHAHPETAHAPFAEIERAIGELEEARRAVALFRSQSISLPKADVAALLDQLISSADHRAATLSGNARN
jgi:hypothetical protein